MKILVITFGDLSAGSTKFRIKQYENFFNTQSASITYLHKKDVDFTILERLKDTDVLINQKCLLPGALSRKIFQHSRRVFFDFDDAIYTRPKKSFSWIARYRTLRRLKMWLKNADEVTVANGYLKKFADQYSSRATVIPMTLDLNVWKPKLKKAGKLTMGWAGAPGNLHHIENLGPVLAKLLNNHPSLSLSIYSGRRPDLPCDFDYVPFQDGGEQEFTQTLDIGLLPLANEEFSRGKSPIKAIQYLACGIPVVGNVWGATAEILKPDNSLAVETEKEWIDGIQALIREPEKAKAMGMNGRQWAEQNFDKNKVQYDFWNLLSK